MLLRGDTACGCSSAGDTACGAPPRRLGLRRLGGRLGLRLLGSGLFGNGLLGGRLRLSGRLGLLGHRLGRRGRGLGLLLGRRLRRGLFGLRLLGLLLFGLVGALRLGHQASISMGLGCWAACGWSGPA